MSYLSQAGLAGHAETQLRLTACVATLGESNPSGWVSARAWQFSARPGWAEAYATALDSKEPVEAHITNGMILAAVQALKNPAN